MVWVAKMRRGKYGVELVEGKVRNRFVDGLGSGDFVVYQG